MGIQEEFDIVIVGCGFCGSVIARLAAEERGKKVLILERRNHIAGNMYDELDKNGILIQRYGPHIFHTEEDWIFRFVSRFANWRPYKTHYGVELDGRCIPAPFGFKAIDMLYPETEAAALKQRLIACYHDRASVPILELLGNEDELIHAFAQLLYDKNYRPYAAKQWQLDPRELDPSVIARMPVILSDRENYFEVKYEALPENGYTVFFGNMLEHPNITVRLNTDARRILRFDTVQGICLADGVVLTVPVVFTGALEELFDDTDAPLPYRSLSFTYRQMDRSSYQPVSILTYPQEHSYLRTTEYAKLMQDPPQGRTVVAFEYPVPYDKKNEPYYPILTAENIKKNNQYLERIKRISNVFPCGRLADYQYYNMDQVIIRAFKVFHTISKKMWGAE